jgi:hypothetical protein
MIPSSTSKCVRVLLVVISPRPGDWALFVRRASRLGAGKTRAPWHKCQQQHRNRDSAPGPDRSFDRWMNWERNALYTAAACHAVPRRTEQAPVTSAHACETAWRRCSFAR